VGRGEPSPGADVGRGEPSSGADVGRGEPSPGADVAQGEPRRPQVIMMVGNKADLAKTREVSFEEASRFAQENGPWCATCNAAHHGERGSDNRGWGREEGREGTTSPSPHPTSLIAMAVGGAPALKAKSVNTVG
jgi:hypothetical protein